MSFRRIISPSALVRTISAPWRCSGERSESSSTSVMATTAFRGVRISWLITARKRLFASVAASATSLARRYSSVRLRASSSARSLPV